MSGAIAPATLDAPREAEPEDSSSPDPESPAPAEPEESPETTLAPESPDGADGETVDGIGWEDLEDLTLEIAGEAVQLDGGSATISYGGASETVFTLQNRVVQGDLDGDGDEDFVAHIVEHSPGSGVFHLIVPVMDDAGRPVVGQTVGLGDRIVVDGITVKDGSATGQLRVTVVSSNAGESSYELMIEVLPAGGSGAGEGGAGGGGNETPTSSVPAVRVPRPVVPDRGRVMYLTFDDGPHPIYTPQVLDVLARHGAMATFFVIGRQAEAYPRLVDRIVAEGHTVANHTWNHESLAGLPKEAFDSTVGSTQSFLGSRGTPCLRPPSGTIDAFTQDWAAEHGLRLTLWTVDPGDWQRPSAEAIADHIVERARAGAVVLLHDGGGDRSQTVEGLDMALERLAGSGLAYKTLCR